MVDRLPLCLMQMVPGETTGATTLDLFKIFEGSPVIYTVLAILSLFAMTLWLYSLLTLRLNSLMPTATLSEIRGLVVEQRFDEALATCQQRPSFFSRIILSGLMVRTRGHQVVIDTMQSEGRRGGSSLWQRISLLNDVAVIAPMLGLLGTVLGLFYAFYNVNRSAESLSAIFDGLGVAIGTTVAGLVVAILAMLFYTTLKFRVVKLLNEVENEALGLVSAIEPEPVRATPARARPKREEES